MGRAQLCRSCLGLRSVGEVGVKLEDGARF